MIGCAITPRTMRPNSTAEWLPSWPRSRTINSSCEACTTLRNSRFPGHYFSNMLYERVLVLRCQARDDDAFEEVVARYTPRLRYYLRKMLGGVQAAEDALQEVWLDAFRGLPGLMEAGAFPAWIYRLARDRAFRELRRRRSYLPLEEFDVAE